MPNTHFQASPMEHVECHAPFYTPPAHESGSETQGRVYRRVDADVRSHVREMWRAALAHCATSSSALCVYAVSIWQASSKSPEAACKMMDVAHWNATFPRYPPTIQSHGWVYGVWYCGTAWTKVTLHGQYPPGFLKRACALFPAATHILHVPSGTVQGPGITVDAKADNARVPQIVALAEHLPFRAQSFDLILSDPPYTPADAAKYQCPPFPIGRFMAEAHRCLIPGGYLGVLHTYYPSYRRAQWSLKGLIAVVTGFSRATRMFSIFQRQ